jgi:essential nuclear protein 1
MPKATTPVSARQGRRHNPLEDDVTASGPLKPTKPGKRKSRHQDEGERFVDSKSSRKILRMGQELADEDQAGDEAIKTNTAFDFESRLEGEEDEEEQTFEEFEEWDEEGEVETIELAPEDLETFNKFFPTQEDSLLRNGWPGAGGEEEADEGPGTNLADLILEKIAAHEAAQAANGGARNEPGPIDEDFVIPEKVVEVYTKCVSFLSRAHLSLELS